MKSSKGRYQAVVVLNPKIKNKDRDKILDKIKVEIEKEKVKVKDKSHFGLKDLAYDIGNESKGDFWIFDVEGTTEAGWSKLNLFLNREAEIIRYLILKV